MFELLIILSRYLFLAYALIFIFNSMLFLLDEAGLTKKSHWYSVFTARTMILLTHITAFLIISYDRDNISFHIETLVLAAVGFMFILLAYFAVSRIYKNSCPLIWNCVLFLLDISLIMLARLNMALAYRQLMWMCVGFAAAVFIPLIINMIPRFEAFEKLYIILSFALVLSTIFFGSTEYGSTNWIYIGPLSFQPSEMVKFLFVFYLASVFRKKVEFKEFIITGALSAMLVMLFVFQRDLGSALIFFMTYLVMLYIATSNGSLVLLGIGGFSVASVIAYNLFSHVRVRVAAWKNPWADIDGGGYQIVQSLFAIGTGGLLGSGLTRGMPTSIPVVTKDFIYAAVCEEFGTIFAICMLGVFIVLFVRGMMIACVCKRRYYSILCAGFTAMMAFQTFIIVGGVIKLIPLTGVTLPFVSYGGTSVTVSILIIGFIQWVNGYHVGIEEEGEIS